jgi:hypothetical protein
MEAPGASALPRLKKGPLCNTTETHIIVSGRYCAATLKK